MRWLSDCSEDTLYEVEAATVEVEVLAAQQVAMLGATAEAKASELAVGATLYKVGAEVAPELTAAVRSRLQWKRLRSYRLL